VKIEPNVQNKGKKKSGNQSDEISQPIAYRIIFKKNNHQPFEAQADESNNNIED